VKSVFRLLLLVPLAGFVLSCGGAPESSSEEPSGESAESASGVDTEPEEPSTGLILTANGEAFVREGFTTKDGWEVEFERVFVTLSDVVAHQTEPAFDPDKDSELKATESVTLLPAERTTNLAADSDGPAIEVIAAPDAPPGTYNAVSWEVVPAQSGLAADTAISMVGEATKDGETRYFTISFDKPLAYQCGEFVGDERKGILEEGEEKSAEVELTLHFDHIFGDAGAPPDDEINTGAVGFEPFVAAFSDGDALIAEGMETMQAELSEEDYQTLVKAIEGLGHVGEGHCKLLETPT